MAGMTESLQELMQQLLRINETEILHEALYHFFEGGRHAEVFEIMVQAERKAAS